MVRRGDTQAVSFSTPWVGEWPVLLPNTVTEQGIMVDIIKRQVREARYVGRCIRGE